MMMFLQSYSSRRRRMAVLLIAFALLVGMFVGMFGTVAAHAADEYDFPEIMYLTSPIPQVSNINTGASDCSVDIGQNVREHRASVAIPIDLSNKGNGIVQIRWYCTDDVTDRFDLYIVAEDDLFSAKRLSGTLNIGYSGFTGSSSVQGVKQVDEGRFTWNVALDGRKSYYLVVSNKRQDEVKDIGYGWGDILVELAYKPVVSSSYGSTLTNDYTFKGFLTLTDTEETYYLEAPKASVATLYYTFDGETAHSRGTGEIAVFNSYGELVQTQQVDASNASNQKEFALTLDSYEAQRYTIRMSGIYGATTLRVAKSETVVSLRQSTEEIAEKVTVYVDTEGIQVNSISYVNREIDEKLLTNQSSWSGAKVVADTNFEVTSNGTYTVRVQGSDGRYHYASIKINNIDNNAPDLSNIVTYSKGKVQIVVVDDNIDYITIGGRKCLRGAYINEEGTHQVTAADRAGNVVHTTIHIDRTAPSIVDTVLKHNGKVVPGYYAFNVSDAVSGIDYVTVDGVRQSGYNGRYGLTVTGTHEISVADLCGNIVSWTIKCDTSSGSGSSGSGFVSGGSGGIN